MDNKRKKVLNTVTSLVLTDQEVLNRLIDEMKPDEGEIIIQQEDNGIKIWSLGLKGELVSTPSTDDVLRIINEKLEGFTPPSNGNNSGNGNGTVVVDLRDYAKIANLKTINGEPIYGNEGDNLEIKAGVDSETLKEYAKITDLAAVEKDVKLKASTAELLEYQINTNQSLYTKVDRTEYSNKINEINQSLNSKASKSGTATESWVLSKLSEASTISIKLVTNLPQGNSINTGIVYLKKDEETDIYYQYIYSKEDSKYVEIGKFETDLSNYYTKDEANDAISSAITDAVSTLELNLGTEIGKKANIGDVVLGTTFAQTVEKIYDTIDKMESFTSADYYKKEETYSKNEIDENFYTKTIIDGKLADVNSKLNSKEFTEFKEAVEESISKKLDITIFNETCSGITDSLEKKIDKDELKKDYYSKEEFDALQAAGGGKEDNPYGMVVIPEEIYEELSVHGRATYNGQELQYSDAVIYYLFDPNEEVTLPEFNPNFNNARVILKEDYSPLFPIIIENNHKCTLVLNGHSIFGPLFKESDGEVLEGDTDSYGVWVRNGGELTIEGSGVIESKKADYSMAVWAQGGTVTIRGGWYQNAGEGCDLIYASEGGKVKIYGGDFVATQKGTQPGTSNEYSALNIRNDSRKDSEIVVYGGRFYGFDPSDAKGSEPIDSPGGQEWHEAHPYGFVAEGYESVKSNYTYTDKNGSIREIWEVRKKEA